MCRKTRVESRRAIINVWGCLRQLSGLFHFHFDFLLLSFCVSVLIYLVNSKLFFVVRNFLFQLQTLNFLPLLPPSLLRLPSSIHRNNTSAELCFLIMEHLELFLFNLRLGLPFGKYCFLLCLASTLELYLPLFFQLFYECFFLLIICKCLSVRLLLLYQLLLVPVLRNGVLRG